MKNFQIRSLTGLIFALLFIFNISLVLIAVIKNDDLYIAYAILLSCGQFYLYEKFKLYRILFACNSDEFAHTDNHAHTDGKRMKHYDINLN
jgi:4-amino-4-deoxy-L-arabinose transferase-like glycosyltransferase